MNDPSTVPLLMPGMQLLVWARMEREREREMEREELDLNLTMKESDVPNGFKEYRRCVSLPEKEREVISPCQDIFFVFFSVEMDLLFYVHDLALAYELKKDVHGSKR